MTVSSPLLGLRMTNTDYSVVHRRQECSDGCDSWDRVHVMLNQMETTYSVSDYIARRSNKENSACHTAEDCLSDIPELVVDQDNLDTVCREKMCEWSYRVCDHFQTGREIVAVSFSYLDRFVDKCSCDRNAFKLAAMTTLYLANKIYGGSSAITIDALAELSRGEFESSHITEMEIIILETLDWRLHPPTAQCFIDSFSKCLSLPSQHDVSKAIYQRAMFFAELAVYDYAFVPKEKSILALASLMNAMEGIDNITAEEQARFVNHINTEFELRFTRDAIESVRDRLWYVYSMSAQYKEDDATSSASPSRVIRKDCPNKSRPSVAGKTGDSSSPSNSPVSVLTATTGRHHH